MAREAKVLITSSNNIGAGIKSAVKDLTGLESNAVRIGKSIQNAFSAAAVGLAVKQVIDFGVESVKAFGEVERKMTVLKVALGGNESSFARMNTLIQSLSRVSLSSKGDIQSLVGELAALGKSDADIERISTAAIRLSNVTGQGLNEAMKQVNNTFSGSFEELAKLVPEIKGLTKEQLAAGGAVDLLNKKFSDISDSMANGVSQRIKNLSDDFGDLRENIGEKMKVAFDPMLTFIDSIVTKWNEAYEAQKKYQKALEDGDPELAAAIKRVADLQKQFDQSKATHELSVHQGLISDDQGRGNMNEISRALVGAIRYLDELKRVRAEKNPESERPSVAPIADAVKVGIDTAFQGWNFESTIAASTGIPPVTETPSSNAGFDLFGGASMDPLSLLGNSMMEFLGPFESFQKLLDPLGTIFAGMMEVVGPLIDDALAPLVGLLKIVGKAIGEFLTPVLQGLAWTVNQVVKGIIWVLNGIISAINGALGWLGVHINKLSLADAQSEGTTVTNTTTNNASASYTGAQSITFNFYNQGNVVGSGGLEELATLINNLITRQARYA